MYVLDTECLLNPAPILWSGECLQTPHHLGLELRSALLKPVTTGTALWSVWLVSLFRSVKTVSDRGSGRILRAAATVCSFLVGCTASNTGQDLQVNFSDSSR